jgi:hypothetical protein
LADVFCASACGESMTIKAAMSDTLMLTIRIEVLFVVWV